jgi:hypothetical protein
MGKIGDVWQELKRIDKISYGKKVFGPRIKFNKILYRISFGLMALIVFTAMAINNFDLSTHFYYKCPETSKDLCKNPFYISPDAPPWERSTCPNKNFCDIKYFQPGQSFGEPPSLTYRLTIPIIWFIFIATFIVDRILQRRKEAKTEEDYAREKKEI